MFIQALLKKYSIKKTLINNKHIHAKLSFTIKKIFFTLTFFEQPGPELFLWRGPGSSPGGIPQGSGSNSSSISSMACAL